MTLPAPEPETAVLPAITALLLGISLLISALGFIRVVYFVSIGYAFSIAAMALALLISRWPALTATAVLHNLLLIGWGLRLGIYLVRREFQPSYRREMASVVARGASVVGLRKVAVWVGVSLLYVCMISPSLFSLYYPSNFSPALTLILQILGLVVMAGGLFLETLADRQKSAFKADHPHDFCSVGLYSWVRCPNYLGEITFWVGNWLLGLAFYTFLLHWATSLIGLACIVLIMMGSTKRLERQQDGRYGDQPAYQTYTRTVPVLFPFVPVYSLKNVRVYLE
ncbi:MAG: DUF1295 domain-containing protein [Ardenticatenaceae bacterium]|nr:DUF1295 domain-containing protein [Ardenticatenaceae bacterium]